MARDSERQRTYDAECKAFAETVYEESVGLHAMELLAKRICSSSWWRENRLTAKPISIREAAPTSKRSTASQAKAEIRIAHGMDTVATLCHELAHFASNDSHGPGFRAAFVEITRLADTPAALRLAKIFNSYGLSVADVSPAPPDLNLAKGIIAPLPSQSESSHTRRIRALLTKASSTSPEEADALRTKAIQLSHKHGVSIAVLEASSAQKSSGLTESKIRVGAGPYVAARSSLLFAIARSRCCEVMWINDSLGRLVSVIGHTTDVKEVELLFLSLDHQARLELLSTKPSGNTLRFRRSWLAGFAAAIDKKLASAERESASTTCSPSTTSLVLKEHRAAARAYRDQLYPKLYATKNQTRAERAGYSLGAQAGTKARVATSPGLKKSRPAISA